MTPICEDALQKAVKEAWAAGYTTAVQAVRDMASEITDEQVRDAVEAVALALEAMKP